MSASDALPIQARDKMLNFEMLEYRNVMKMIAKKGLGGGLGACKKTSYGSVDTDHSKKYLPRGALLSERLRAVFSYLPYSSHAVETGALC